MKEIILFVFVYTLLLKFPIENSHCQIGKIHAAFEDDPLNTENLCLNGYFDAQVDQIMRRIRLAPHKIEQTKVVIQDVENAVQKCWPGSKVHEFSATITGLAFKTSDVDLFVDLPEWAKGNRTEAVLNTQKCLSRFTIFTDVQAITSVLVPIVRFSHVSTKRRCDINFEGHTAVRISKLTAYFLHMDRRALQLAIIIKYWAKLHKMQTYMLTMIVVFYLQQVNILPPVFKLQEKTETNMVENWNTAFQEDFHFKSTNSQLIYELLGGFFCFYKDFLFEELVVSPFLGRPVPKAAFSETKTLPGELEQYKLLARNNTFEPITAMPKICVQDPFVHARICTPVISDESTEVASLNK